MTLSLLPDRNFVAEASNARLAERRREAGPRPTADGTRGRGSMAGNCARAIAFQALPIASERELSSQNIDAFRVGQDVHDRLQESLRIDFGARIEVPVSFRPTHDVSGNIDAVVDVNPATGETRPNLTVVEIKSMKEYAFKMATGDGQWSKPYLRKDGTVRPGDPAGPKVAHITQAAIYALAPQVGAEYLWMIYYNKNSGEIAEWVLPMDEPLSHIPGEPTPRRLAETELARLDSIFALLDTGVIPARSIPGVDPSELLKIPEPDSKDGPFLCRYCSHSSLCRTLGAGPVALPTALDAAPTKETTVETTTEVTRDDLDRLLARLLAMPPEKRAEMKAIWPEGIPTIAQGGHTVGQFRTIEQLADDIEREADPFHIPNEAAAVAQIASTFGAINWENVAAHRGVTVEALGIGFAEWCSTVGLAQTEDLNGHPTDVGQRFIEAWDQRHPTTENVPATYRAPETVKAPALEAEPTTQESDAKARSDHRPPFADESILVVIHRFPGMSQHSIRPDQYTSIREIIEARQ